MYDLDVEGGFKAVWDEKGKGNKAADFFTAFPPLKKPLLTATNRVSFFIGVLI